MTPHRRTATTALKGILWTGVIVLAVAGCSQNAYSSNGSSTEVSQAAWTGSEWPFTVPNGILGCNQAWNRHLQRRWHRVRPERHCSRSRVSDR